MKPLVNKKYLLERFPGKGGWTFARIPEISQNKEAHFGWVKVRGTIDGVEIRKYNLMPMGDGRLFLAVKKDTRDRINKKAGDFVHVILYPDNDPLDVPEELKLCLQDDPSAYDFFNSLSESERKYYLDWIYSAKKEETKVDRMAKSINRLAAGLKFYEQV